MTPLSVRNVRLARAGLVLAAVGAVMMVANYFASAIPVKLGMVPHSEVMDEIGRASCRERVLRLV